MKDSLEEYGLDLRLERTGLVLELEVWVLLLLGLLSGLERRSFDFFFKTTTNDSIPSISTTFLFFLAHSIISHRFGSSWIMYVY
jgi:hypothetical protein